MADILDPIHPGEVLAEEYLKPLDIDLRSAAEALGVPELHLRDLVEGRRAVTAETALRLSRFLQTSPLFWLGLQARYDVDVERRRLGVRLLEEVAVYAPEDESLEPIG